MNYRSTRDNSISVVASQAIIQGISKDGGLFVPESMPWLSYDDIKMLADTDYANRAAKILGFFLSDFSDDELMNCVAKAYTREKFETESITPLYMLENNIYILELWHGPTCAFKDIALQILPHLLNVSIEKSGEKKTVIILVATSGDTGKAALEGFKDVQNTKIMVFYPENGVSPMQKLQMNTTDGSNVYVCSIKGTFDDAQNAVKSIFTDKDVNEKLNSNEMIFSSANSINWGRLVPQIVYYISAYCDLIKNDKITCGEQINVVVPTGNFGNILAAYYSKKMGIPINKLICASNSNNVLTDFFQNGIYDKNRPFFTTISPSMDILISSNLERLLYDLSACDDQVLKTWMNELLKTGKYEVDNQIKNKLSENFWAGFCDDDDTKKTIKNMHDKFSYVCDPHTAVAINVYQQYKEKTADFTKTIIASTASPFKFAGDVLDALKGKSQNQGEFEKINELSELSMLVPPKQIVSIKEKELRFFDCCEKSNIKDYIFEKLGI
jgi:threonine synthase